MLNDYIVSLVRTYVPAAVGTALAWLAVHFHLVVDADTGTKAKFVAAALVVAVWYAIVRAIEERWPAVGRIIVGAGLKRALSYTRTR